MGGGCVPPIRDAVHETTSSAIGSPADGEITEQGTGGIAGRIQLGGVESKLIVN